ncbi:MAG: alpha/beta hydrolase family protein [Planctomycetaceae bacterium]|jgi:dienelactone hydrolase|nr:alpha/beta hydrolase family protein [Planctomycetaceae bacterium]
MRYLILLAVFVFAAAGDTTFVPLAFAQPLPGTDALTVDEDCAGRNTRLITEFLDRKIAESEQQRTKHWNRQFGDRATYEKSVTKNRERFRHIIGVRDKRKPFESPELCETLNKSALIAETATHNIYAVRWDVFETLKGEGLLLELKNGQKPEKTIIYLPHSDGTIGGLTSPDQFKNCRVIIPALVTRNIEQYGRSKRGGREYIYRAAFQLGRHIIGYEVQEILALVDWLKKTESAIVCVAGYGDGGLLAFYAAAADTRIDEAVIAGYFSNRNRVCEEPIDRNIFGLLDQFGDAEIAALIAPRKLSVVSGDAPQLVLKSENGNAPGTLNKLADEAVRAEIDRAEKLVAPLNWKINHLPAIPQVSDFLPPEVIQEQRQSANERVRRLVNGMDRHTQDLLNRAEITRRNFWEPLNRIEDAKSPEFAEKIEWYRKYFAEEVIGHFDDSLDDPKPRTRKKEETDKYVMYEAEMDVFGGIVQYGLLLIPKGIKEGEKRPVVVCQHGLESRPAVTLRGGKPGYSAMATELCERGYITFAPQGIFTGGDKFRYNQRQLNSLGKTLFSIMVPQHQQLLNWLGTLPFVDKDRMAFYGLSYGGKTAMRVPPLVKNYCLSICSADFNAWNVKNASAVYPFSYIWSGEYEIFEFDLANTFDYSDMAKLIAPRPFMVERGHHDGVGWDEFVGFEYAKVLRFYTLKWNMPERTEIHWFNGGHKISGDKTYPFLDRWLQPERRR